MKHVIAIILLCLPTQLSAADRCAVSRNNRDDVARAMSAKPPAVRIEVGRSQKVRAPGAWERLLLIEQQIL